MDTLSIHLIRLDFVFCFSSSVGLTVSPSASMHLLRYCTSVVCTGQEKGRTGVRTGQTVGTEQHNAVG